MPRVVLTFLLAFMLGPALRQPLSQPVVQDKHKREKFGSSLNRLKWDPEQQAAVDSGGRNTPGRAAQEDEAVKLNTLLVVFDVLVFARGKARTIDGLTKDDFAVSEDGQPQRIASLATGADANAPRSIILILDYSRSQELYLETSVEAAKILVSRLGPRDEMSIVTDDVELMVDLTRDRHKLDSALDSLRKRVREKEHFGRSFQLSALFASVRELVPSVENRPIIIFQTDGDEAAAFRDQPNPERFAFLWGRRPAAGFGLNDIYRSASESRATIYSVVTNDRLIGLPPEQFTDRVKKLLMWRRQEMHKGKEPAAEPVEPSDSEVELWGEIYGRGQLACDRVATLSGGWTEWLEKPDQAADIYQRILSDINRRYIIGYYPTNTLRDGKLRKVKIEVRGHPEYEVHGRSTYRSPST